jgi:hypothetical protein
VLKAGASTDGTKSSGASGFSPWPLIGLSGARVLGSNGGGGVKFGSVLADAFSEVEKATVGSSTGKAGGVTDSVGSASPKKPCWLSWASDMPASSWRIVFLAEASMAASSVARLALALCSFLRQRAEHVLASLLPTKGLLQLRQVLFVCAIFLVLLEQFFYVLCCCLVSATNCDAVKVLYVNFVPFFRAIFLYFLKLFFNKYA